MGLLDRIITNLSENIEMAQGTRCSKCRQRIVFDLTDTSHTAICGCGNEDLRLPRPDTE